MAKKTADTASSGSAAQAVDPADPAEVRELPTTVRVRSAPVGDRLPADLDVGVQCAARFDGPGVSGFGTLVRLMGEGLTLLCHGPPVAGARLRLRVEFDDDEVISCEVVVVSARPDPGAGPARVTARFVDLPSETSRAILDFLRRRAEALASGPILRVALRPAAAPAIPVDADPAGEVTELGAAPRRGWIATLRQRARGLRPDIVGPARPAFRGRVSVLPDGHGLQVGWSGEDDWQLDWDAHLSQGLLPLPVGLEGGSRRRVQLLLPDGTVREAMAGPARGAAGVLRLLSPWVDDSVISRTV